MTERRDMKQDSYVTSSPASPPTVARVSDDTQSQGGAGWQPIGTAPKDGSRFRARGKDWGIGPQWHYTDAEWREDDWAGPNFYGPDGVHLGYLTDWKPIKLSKRLSVSDGSREAGETVGLDPKDDSAVTAGQTPHPSPVDYTEVAKELRNMHRKYANFIPDVVQIALSEAAQVIEAQAAELRCRDALIKDHLGKIMHLENRVDEEAHRAETAESRLADAVKVIERLEAIAAECVKFDQENLEAITDEANAIPSNNFSVRRHWQTRLELSRSWQRVVAEHRARSFLSTGGDSHG